jgi:hypothetical protein
MSAKRISGAVGAVATPASIRSTALEAAAAIQTIGAEETSTASVSGNAICRSCFLISTLSCYVRSTLVRWCPSSSAAIVTHLVTHPGGNARQ